MKNTKYTLLFIIVGLLAIACKPDFDINAEYKDVTITYAIINPSDSMQYIKIYKGYLTQGNAFEAAKDLNNISYYDSINVVLNEIVNNKVVKTIVLDTTTAIPKDPGIFASPTQVLYCTAEPLNTAAQYELEITNKYSGKKSTAKTAVVDNFRLKFPMTGAQFNLLGNSMRLTLSRATNAVAYEVVQNFYYIEVDKATKEVKKCVISRTVNSLPIRDSGAGDVIYSFRPDEMYKLINGNLKPNDKVDRYRDGFECVELVIWAAEKNLLTYMDVNTSSSSLLNDKNTYSNFESEDNSAFGIFASRNVHRQRYNINNASEDSLVYGQYTRGLGFDYYRNYSE